MGQEMGGSEAGSLRLTRETLRELDPSGSEAAAVRGGDDSDQASCQSCLCVMGFDLSPTRTLVDPDLAERFGDAIRISVEIDATKFGLRKDVP